MVYTCYFFAIYGIPTAKWHFFTILHLKTFYHLIVSTFMGVIFGSNYAIKSHFSGKMRQKPVLGVRLLMIFLVLSTSFLKGQTAQFSVTADGGNFCAPAKINFVPTFSEKPTYFFWKFGQNDEESEMNSPTVTYTTPGNYKVVLTAVFKNVIREVVTNVKINGPATIAIQSQNDFLCKPGDNVFTLKTADTLTRVAWKIGNGNMVVNSQNIPLQHAFPNFGVYDISVEAENKWGCKAIARDNFRVEKLKAVIKDTLISGCLPANVNFAANIVLPAGSSVTRYLWNFDDGTAPRTTTGNSVFHTFSRADTFVTTLSVTTLEGCENTWSFSPVALGTPPVISEIMASKDTICASEVLNITAASDKANSYYCEISDGSTYESLTGKFSHEFKGLGTFKIKVTPKYNGCPGVADSIEVLVRGVIANYSFTNSCTQKNRFNFRNTSIGAVNSIEWNFEAGATSLAVPNPEYTFPEQGRFPLVLIVKNNATGCADTAAGLIYTAKPKLEPTDTFVCLGNAASMLVKESYVNPRTTYNWNIAGKIINNNPSGNISRSADAEGIFTNRVIIFNGIGYCRDTLIQPMRMRVAGISADFKIISGKCTDERTFIQNTSASIYGIRPETKWNWDFGNGIFSDSMHPAPVVFRNPGNFRIFLMVTDAKGCVDSTRELVRIKRSPLLKLLPKEQKVCLGQEFSLTAYHTSAITWSPSGLVDCDTCSVVKVKPLRPTEYQVISKDSIGCTSTDTVKLDVWYPFELASNLIRDTAVCYGNSIQYDLKTNQKVVSWFPDSGLSANNIPNPLVRPNVTTTYIATVSDSAGCFFRKDTAVLTINPLPVAEHDSLLIVPFEAAYTISPRYSPDIISYNWQHENLLSCSDCPNPSGKAVNAALFELNVVSDKGCKSSTTINLVIDCSSKNINMPTAFTPDNNGLNDYYYPLTKGIRQVKRFAVFNRFGEIIFERRDFIPNNRTDGWDGSFKGILQPPGMYTYWVQILCGSGNLESYKGSFFLFK